MLDVDFEKHSERLVLRPYRETDYESWRSTLASLPEQQSIWDQGPRDTKELTKTQFLKILGVQKKHREQDFFYDFVAFDKSNGHLIGYASLMDVSRAIFQNAYLGYGIHSPHWGKGYGKEMVSALLQVAFGTLDLHRVEAGIEPANTPSIALAESLGMRYEGLSRRRLYVRDQWQDMALYAITAEDLGLEALVGDAMEHRR